jgi:hypothetical protein
MAVQYRRAFGRGGGGGAFTVGAAIVIAACVAART